MNKKKRIIHRFFLGVITITMFCLLLSGCSMFRNSSKYSDEYDGDEHQLESMLDYYTMDEMMDIIEDHYGEYPLKEYIFEGISLDDFIENKYGGSWSDFLEAERIPDFIMYIINLQDAGQYTTIDEIRKLIKNSGFHYSDLFGYYVSDKNNVIHDTDGECFEKISSKEMSPFHPVDCRDIDVLINEYNYSYCPICNKH